VTAATAASAELGVSLTRRGLARHVVFVTPAQAGASARTIGRRACSQPTRSHLHGRGARRGNQRGIDPRGKPKTTPLVLVESATLPEQRILRGTLADLPALALGPGAALRCAPREVLGAARAERSREKIERSSNGLE